MPSLLVTVFILQLAIHLVNTVGASTVNTLLWNLYNSLPTPTSKAFKEQKKLQAEYLATRKQLNSISAQDQEPREEQSLPRRSQSQIHQHRLRPALDLHQRPANAHPVLVRQTAHVLASARPRPVLWRVAAELPARAAGVYKHTGVGHGVRECYPTCQRCGGGGRGTGYGDQGGEGTGGEEKGSSADEGGRGEAWGEHGEGGGEKGVIDCTIGGLKFVSHQLKTQRMSWLVQLDLATRQSNTAKMVSWGTIKSVLIFFGPMLLPKAIGYYRSFKENSKKGGRPIRPVPTAVSRALGILFVISVILLIATLPIFSEENIFTKTQSRIQIPVDVLFTRLTAIRPNGLTELDLRLREKLVSLESKLLYLKYGPDAIGNCLFCKADDQRSFYYYTMSSVLTPHVFNLAVLATATSGMFVGEEGTMWRRFATICSVIIAVVDMTYLSEYDHKLNAKATRLEDLDMFFWRTHTYRFVVLAGLDALVGWLLFLSSTNRAFVIPVSPAERLESATKVLESARSKMSAAAVVLNTVNRDEVLRGKADGYWVNESRVMSEIMAEREVVDSVNSTLQSRVNMAAITLDADSYAKSMMGSFQAMEQAA
ncbi:hypothetical protein V496_04852 [Pseudogymnoascus sp. VKM F-4515 (FW-2607)]|nr:hypothetical protein V496_04852 [Pseudogymnoascus sp. VKM F-4515 (FW-2607)]